jgi:precorrin-6B methylase 2
MTSRDFEQLMQLAGSFQQAKVLLVACELGLFTHLAPKPKSAATLAAELGADVRSLTILMDALVALGILAKQENSYSNTPLAATYLVDTSPNYRGHILRHINHCWDYWSQLLQVVKQGQPATDITPTLLHDEEEYNRAYIWGMNDVGQERAVEVLKHLELRGVRRLLDLGGGAATYSIAFAKAYPKLQATVFDLPLTLKVAEENIRQHGVQSRVHTRAGDFFRDDIGRGYDLVWVSQVLHAQGESGCRQLVDKAYGALAPGGRLVVHDFLLSEERTSPLKSAMFAVHMLAVTEGGRVYTPGEIMDWLRQAGFVNISCTQVSDNNMLVEGSKGS